MNTASTAFHSAASGVRSSLASPHEYALSTRRERAYAQFVKFLQSFPGIQMKR